MTGARKPAAAPAVPVQPSATRNSRPMAGGWRLRRTKLDATTCTCRASLTRPLGGSCRAAGGAYPRWGPGGRELLYRAPDGRLMTIPLRLVGSSVELGTPSVVMRLVDAPGVHPYPYDVAADGRILALTPASGAVQDLTLTVLMNWQAALEP